MNQTPPSTVRCRYYERQDWLKIDVLPLLAPWIDRVSEVYQLRKIPAKHLVTYALAEMAVPRTQEILDAISEIFDDPDRFRRQYRTRLKPPLPDTSILINRDGVRPLTPRKVNFLDLVDYWAVPLNRTFSVPIIQARDVTKIALVFFLADKDKFLAKTIGTLAEDSHHELFTDEGKVTFPELILTAPE